MKLTKGASYWQERQSIAITHVVRRGETRAVIATLSQLLTEIVIKYNSSLATAATAN